MFPVQCGEAAGAVGAVAGCGVEGDQLRDCLVLDSNGRGYASYCTLEESISFVCSFPGEPSRK